MSLNKNDISSHSFCHSHTKWTNHRTYFILRTSLLFFCFSLATFFNLLYAQNVVIVIIDGARYTETLGDPDRTYIPELWNLAQDGAYIDPFYNDHITYTSKAIPAIWCGAWTPTIDTFYNGSSTQYTALPSVFEYYRKQKNIPSQKCLYSLKYVPSLWLQSFHDDYGPAYWPNVLSQGNNDDDVLHNTLDYIEEYQPSFMVVYFADVDQAGHSGNWNAYTQAIQNADEKVGLLWSALQNMPFYKDNTILMVTNDHGRHDDAHGGFKGHGDGCNGCREIMLLAVGPGIKTGYVSSVYGHIPDVAVTAAAILDIDMEHATGDYLSDLFIHADITNLRKDITWEANAHGIRIRVSKPESVSLSVTNLKGQEVRTLIKDQILDEEYMIGPEWHAGLHNGVFIISLRSDYQFSSKKVLITAP